LSDGVGLTWLSLVGGFLSATYVYVKDWAEYDEEGQQSVGIFSVEHRFISKK
jgi:hypothetical protein